MKRPPLTRRQAEVLAQIARRPGVNLSELAGERGVSGVARIVVALENLGLVHSVRVQSARGHMERRCSLVGWEA